MQPEWFGPRLRELREEKGWTQKELADKAGIGLSTVQNFEQNRRYPEWRTLLLLCNALGVGLEAFGKPPKSLPVSAPPTLPVPAIPPPVGPIEPAPAEEPKPKKRGRKPANH